MKHLHHRGFVVHKVVETRVRIVRIEFSCACVPTQHPNAMKTVVRHVVERLLISLDYDCE